MYKKLLVLAKPKLVARLLASDFPSENPRTQTRNFPYTKTLPAINRIRRIELNKNNVSNNKMNLLDSLTETLQQDERLVIDGNLAKNKIVELALKLDKDLLKLLLKNEKLKEQFFTDVDGTMVFDKHFFQRFVANKQFLPDSYTAFKIKIGLSDNGEDYLSEKNDVSLIWPYKDCVLEGGQTNEDAKRNEIFWNETLANDEIDRLKDPKILNKFMKFNQDGEIDISEFSLTDNYIIKGNNLLGLKQLAKDNTPTRVIGLKLGRTEDAVRSKASELGVSLKPTNQSPYKRRK